MMKDEKTKNIQEGMFVILSPQNKVRSTRPPYAIIGEWKEIKSAGQNIVEVYYHTPDSIIVFESFGPLDPPSQDSSRGVARFVCYSAQKTIKRKIIPSKPRTLNPASRARVAP